MNDERPELFLHLPADFQLTVDDGGDELLIEHLSFGDAKVGEITFDLKSFDLGQFSATADTSVGSPTSRPLIVTVPGKRYWWKPWRRRPDRVFHFPNATIIAKDTDA